MLKFKVGDKVKIKTSAYVPSGFFKTGYDIFSTFTVKTSGEYYAHMEEMYGAISVDMLEPAKPQFIRKFKVGDKIRLITDFGMAAEGGAEAIVKGYNPLASNFEWVIIDWIESPLRHGQTNGSYSQENFELVPESPQAFIVILDRKGKLLPSAQPFIHKLHADAVTEAKRLAVKEPGSKFTVFQAVAYAQTAKPEATVTLLN